MTPDDRTVVSSWSWEDQPLEQPQLKVAGHHNFVAEDECGGVVGYCSFGAHAMIPTLVGDERFANVAWGLHPNLIGEGNGVHFIGAVVTLGKSLYPLRIVRAQIRESNTRSLKAAIRAGFVEAQRLSHRVIVEHHGSRPRLGH